MRQYAGTRERANAANAANAAKRSQAQPTQPTQPKAVVEFSSYFFFSSYFSLSFLFFPFFFFYILFSSFYSSRPLVYTLGALLAPHLRRRLAVAGILLQRDQLLRPEPLIVHHRRGLDQILKMGPRQKIA